jgi:hypothetical protein
MQDTFRGTRTLRFLWYEQRGLCTVCNTQITRITGLAPSPLRSPRDGWFTKRRKPRSTSYRVHNQCISVSKPRLPKEAFEGLELCEGKLSCTVLRGLDGSNPVRLLGHLPQNRFGWWMSN